MSRSLGLRGPDAPDDRDRKFSAHRAATGPIPLSASVDDAHVVAKDQGNTSSCVGQATAQALRLAYLKRGIACPDLSALFVYRLARNIDGTTNDDGSFLRSGAQAVQKLGCAPEFSWPFNEAEVNTEIPFSAQHDAFDRAGVRRYYRIAAGDTDGIKRAIAAGLSVTGGWDVDQAFVSSDGQSIIDVQNQSSIAGGHAMCVCSYANDVFGILGSWGSNYGHSGRIKVTKGFMAAGSDFWVFDTQGDAP